MAFSTRGWVTACLFALVGCYSESDTNDDDGDDSTTGNPTDPTLTTTTVDPSVTTSMTTTSPTATSADPSTDTDPSVDSSGTTDSDTDPSTTTDPTENGCPGQGDTVCNDGAAVVGELCFLEPEAKNGGDEQIGALAIFDIDGDDVPDVAFADGADGFVSFVAGTELQNATPILGALPTWSVDVGPLGDTVAVAFGGANAEVYIARFDGRSFLVDAPLGAPGEFVTVRFADFDDNDRLDLLVGSEESSTLYLYLNDGLGGLDVAMLTTIDLGPIGGIADMRILYDVESMNPGVAMLMLDGRLFWTPPNDSALGVFTEIDPTQTYGDPTTGRLAAGDLDVDGDTDLAVGYDGRAFVFRSNGNGYMPPETIGESAIGGVVPAIADVDNDGIPDLLLADPLDTELEIYVADGDSFAPADPIPLPTLPRGVGAADFNEDCAADIVALGPDWFEVAESNP